MRHQGSNPKKILVKKLQFQNYTGQNKKNGLEATIISLV
jgi:hypothetical protein